MLDIISSQTSQDGLIKSLQITQNKSARFLNGNILEDKVCTSKIFNDLNLLSVNQLNAQIKIREVWKSLKNENYPTKWEYVLPNPNVNSGLRSGDKKILKTSGISRISDSTFVNDAARLWNLTPDYIKNCISIHSVKKEINKFVKTLPL